MNRIALAVAACALLLAACKKPAPKMEETSDAAPAAATPSAEVAPAQPRIDANPTGGAALIRKAQDAAKAGNADAKRAEGTPTE